MTDDKAIATAAYDNVSAQIAEHEHDIERARINIINLQAAIQSERETIRLRLEAQRALRRRKRIFATAKHQLQLIDEGL